MNIRDFKMLVDSFVEAGGKLTADTTLREMQEFVKATESRKIVLGLLEEVKAITGRYSRV